MDLLKNLQAKAYSMSVKTHHSSPVSTLALAYRRGSRFAVCHPALGWQTFVYLPYDADTRNAYSIAADGKLSPVEPNSEDSALMTAQGI